MVDKEDIINSVRLHNAINSIIREYGYMIKPVKGLRYANVIEDKGREIVGYNRSYYLNDFVTPRIYITSKYKKKTEDMVNALKLINVSVVVQPTKVIADTLKGWWECKMRW